MAEEPAHGEARDQRQGGQAMGTQACSPQGPGAVRLIFEYDGDQVRLVSQQRVDMAITGADIALVETAGFYVDSRDAAGKTLARVPAPTAFARSLEVFPERAGEPIVRVDVPRPKGAFTVVVPAPRDADHVTVVEVSPGRPGVVGPSSRGTTDVAGTAQATDIATFELTPTP